MTSIIFDQVSFAYSHSTPIFQGMSARFDGGPPAGRGRIVAIMGPSGSGKTTLLRLVSGIEKPRLGLLGLSPPNASVSYLQQEPVLFEHLSRTENARYFTLVQRTRSQFDELTFQRLSTQLKLARVLEARGGTDQMSGGERQRLSLLRALSIRPQILLLDEPCTGLDIGVKLEFLHMLREVIDEFGLLALYVTHHSDEAEFVADELMYLSMKGRDSGVTTAMMSIDDAFNHPPSIEAAQAFMGTGSNLISCNVDESGVASSTAGFVLGRIHPVTISSGKYSLIFRPEIVRWTESGQQHIQPVGHSARYWFVHALENQKLVGPKTESPPKSFYLEGTVVAFREGGGSGVRAAIYKQHQL